MPMAMTADPAATTRSAPVPRSAEPSPPPQAPTPPPAEAAGHPVEAEAARYAVLRRLGPALRHDLVVHLQAVAMMAEVLSARQARDPQAADLPGQLARMHQLARDAVAGALRVAGWLMPPEDDAVDLRQGVEESLALVRSSLGFRGLQLQVDLPETGLTVSGDQLRHLLLAALLHLSDQGAPAGALRVQARVESGSALLRLALEPLGFTVDEGPARSGRVEADEEAGYRDLRWPDLQALAEGLPLARQFTPARIELRLPRVETRTPLQVAPR